MDIKVKVNIDDIFKFSLYNYYISVKGAVLALFLFGAAWIMIFYHKGTDLRMVAIFALLLFALFLFQLTGIYKEAGKQVKAMGAEMPMHLGERGIDMRIRGKREHARWNQICGFGKVAGCYVLYVNPNAGFLVPERQLTPEQKDKFLEICRENLDERLKKKVK